MKQYKFYVSGTHCNACKILIEEIISEQKEVSKVSVNLVKEELYIEGEINETPEELHKKLSKLLEEHKYAIHLEHPKKEGKIKSITYAIPIGIIILGLFFLLQRSGLVNVGFQEGLSPLTVIFIGIIASLSTCLAMVGGFVLSLSAEISKDVSGARPIVFFHIGRLFGFTLLGALLGELGNVISINNTITAILGILAAIIMVILGLNLLGIFNFTKRLELTLPRKTFDRLKNIGQGFFAPLIVGAGTFFLPCGFTQAMQFASLSSGSFLKGGMIMGLFALGTLPMLIMLSFGSFKFAHTKYAEFFFKTVGIVVIGLGLFSILGGLASVGIIKPLFNI